MKYIGQACTFFVAAFAAGFATAGVHEPADALLFSALQVGGSGTTACSASAAPNETVKGSADAEEALCLSQHLGLATPLITDIKLNTFNFIYNGQIGGIDSWFIDVAPKEPGYFLLKYGVGNTGFDTHYYFQNVADFTKLVFTSTQVNGLLVGCNTNMGQSCSNNGFALSHYATYGTASSSSSGGASSSGDIPTPGTSSMAVLGLGLIAGGFISRAKRRAA